MIRIPAYQEAAVIKRGNGRLILTAGRCAVYQKLRCDHTAIIRMDLSANVIRRAVAVTTVIAPGNHEAAILQANNFRLILGRADITVYPELASNFRTVRGKNTCPDIVAATRSRSIIMTAATTVTPGDNEITIRK